MFLGTSTGTHAGLMPPLQGGLGRRSDYQGFALRFDISPLWGFGIGLFKRQVHRWRRVIYFAPALAATAKEGCLTGRGLASEN